MRVQVLDEATADLADGYLFYERQAEGLEEYFLDSLRVPCAVYYRVEERVAHVRAVLDCRRDPDRIAERLR